MDESNGINSNPQTDGGAEGRRGGRTEGRKDGGTEGRRDGRKKMKISAEDKNDQ